MLDSAAAKVAFGKSQRIAADCDRDTAGLRCGHDWDDWPAGKFRTASERVVANIVFNKRSAGL